MAISQTNTIPIMNSTFHVRSVTQFPAWAGCGDMLLPFLSPISLFHFLVMSVYYIRVTHYLLLIRMNLSFSVYFSLNPI